MLFISEWFERDFSLCILVPYAELSFNFLVDHLTIGENYFKKSNFANTVTVGGGCN